MICPICPKNHEATYDYTNRNGNKVYKCELSSSIFLEDLTGYTFYIELDNKEKYCLYGSVHFNTEYTRVQLNDAAVEYLEILDLPFIMPGKTYKENKKLLKRLLKLKAFV